MNQKIILILLAITLSYQTQYVPIPKTTVGIPFGATNGQISIELIYDPVCTYIFIQVTIPGISMSILSEPYNLSCQRKLLIRLILGLLVKLNHGTSLLIRLCRESPMSMIRRVQLKPSSVSGSSWIISQLGTITFYRPKASVSLWMPWQVNLRPYQE